MYNPIRHINLYIITQYCSVILQRISIIVGDAGFESWTSAPEDWCAIPRD